MCFFLNALDGFGCLFFNTFIRLLALSTPFGGDALLIHLWGTCTVAIPRPTTAWPLEGNRPLFRTIHMENPIHKSGSERGARGGAGLKEPYQGRRSVQVRGRRGRPGRTTTRSVPASYMFHSPRNLAPDWATNPDAPRAIRDPDQ